MSTSTRAIAIAGEIVDGNCYPGIMKPGRTKTHRACAIRCISGGVPPVFRATNSSGQSLYFLLSDLKGEAVNPKPSITGTRLHGNKKHCNILSLRSKKINPELRF